MRPQLLEYQAAYAKASIAEQKLSQAYNDAKDDYQSKQDRASDLKDFHSNIETLTENLYENKGALNEQAAQLIATDNSFGEYFDDLGDGVFFTQRTRKGCIYER